jgi:hypothetical protein
MSSENLSQSPVQLPPKKSSTKVVVSMMFLGILVGVTLVSIYMPRVIAWYAEPPSPMGVSCVKSIEWALTRLQTAQMIAVGVGALLGFLIGLRVAKRK